MTVKNSQGKVYYGMHFYPGVAEYQEPDKEPYRVFLNEDTIRSMDPSFAGRPIFVEHVDEVEENIDELRKEADGWVIESFFNSADGKHWVKFIIVSERGEKAIQRGMRLSNAYIPKTFASGGLWNGVQYAKEVTGGEYEHLAIVRNPRYEESVIMTPEKFKSYNEDKKIELTRLSNSKDKEKGKSPMKWFKREEVKNALDPNLSVLLPKSKREVTITELVNEADELAEKKKANNLEADHSHMVKLHDGSMCNVGDLLAKHQTLSHELDKLKGDPDKEEMENESEEDKDSMANEDDDKDDKDESSKKKSNQSDSADSDEGGEEDEDEEAEAQAAQKKKNDIAAAQKKKEEAKAKAERLRNANSRTDADEEARVEFSGDQVARGKSRYGSN